MLCQVLAGLSLLLLLMLSYGAQVDSEMNILRGERDQAKDIIDDLQKKLQAVTAVLNDYDLERQVRSIGCGCTVCTVQGQVGIGDLCCAAVLRGCSAQRLQPGAPGVHCAAIVVHLAAAAVRGDSVPCCDVCTAKPNVRDLEC
jgi:hypothetical protein